MGCLNCRKKVFLSSISQICVVDLLKKLECQMLNFYRRECQIRDKVNNK